MSRSAWPLIYLRVVSVFWLVRLQVYPVQSDVKAPALEPVPCRTSSLMRLFVLLFNKTSAFLYVFTFFFFFYIALWCWAWLCEEFLFVWRIFCWVLLSIFFQIGFAKKACVIFVPAFFFYKNPHKLPFLGVSLFAVASLCLEAWFDQPKWNFIVNNVCQRAAHTFTGQPWFISAVKINVSEGQLSTQCNNYKTVVEMLNF